MKCRESASNAIGIATESAETAMEMQRKCKERNQNCNGKCRDNYGNAEKVHRKASELQRKAPGRLWKCRTSAKKGIRIATATARTTMEM